MNLDEYLLSDDNNAFWRLSSGEQLNLLDEALEQLDNAQKRIAEYSLTLRNARSFILAWIPADGMNPMQRQFAKMLREINITLDGEEEEKWQAQKKQKEAGRETQTD